MIARLLGVLVCWAALSAAQSMPSPLFGRGYTVIPTPQKVTLGAGDFKFDSTWRLELGEGVRPDDIAAESLKELLHERFDLSLSSTAGASLRLAISARAVSVSGTTDSNQSAIAEQAYRMELSPKHIAITGNSAIGLFYGVQTFVQMLKRQNGALRLPEGEIQDWPDLELRAIYWDDAHHLEHLDVLKAALRQASFYKINGFAIKLEGHFQYQHAPAIVEPYALTPAELQELTDYGLRYHVQLIPYLDAPAHDAFILKHPEYASLREYPENNYEFCATNPKAYELFEGMFDDLLAANKGGKYFVLSTDEPYYVGLANNDQCHEAERAKELGSVGKLFGEFVTKTARYLHDRGRTVIFWGEYPMKPEDIDSLPSYLVNGEMYGPRFDPVFRKHGIKQMIYTWTEGEEQMFPSYYRNAHGPGRLQEMFEHVSLTSLDSLSSTRPDFAQPAQADLMGVFVAGWGDPGLHPETFWLGYVVGSASAWRRAGTVPTEMANTFFPLFYGDEAASMGRLYQLMSEQASFWEDSWETGRSSARTPIWGNSFGQFDPPKPAHDQYLAPMPVPSSDLLRIGSNWRTENLERLNRAGMFLTQNDELIDLLQMNIERVRFNRYNLQVLLSIAGIFRQNLLMLLDLGRISDALNAAAVAAGKSDAANALSELDRAIDITQTIRQNRNEVLQDATSIWYQSWFPRVSEANGRKFLDQVDDVKDHQPVRTIDMSYLVFRQLLYPLGHWTARTMEIRNEYAAAHKLPARALRFDWKDTATLNRTQRVADQSDN